MNKKMIRVMVSLLIGSMVVSAQAGEGDTAVNLLPNGSFEKSADGKTPTGWKIWNSSKFKGEISIGTTDAKAGNSYLTITDAELKSPAYVLTPKLDVVAGKTYKVSYWLKGDGKMFPMLSEYQGSKYLSTYVPERDNKWKQASGEWTQYSYEVTVSAKTKQISISFRVRGTVSIDAVSIILK